MTDTDNQHTCSEGLFIFLVGFWAMWTRLALHLRLLLLHLAMVHTLHRLDKGRFIYILIPLVSSLAFFPIHSHEFRCQAMCMQSERNVSYLHYKWRCSAPSNCLEGRGYCNLLVPRRAFVNCFQLYAIFFSLCFVMSLKSIRFWMKIKPKSW